MVDRPDSRKIAPSTHRSSNLPDPHKRTRRIRVLAALAGSVLITMLLLVGLTDSSSESEIVLGDKIHTIQMDVLNGVGRSNLAQQMTDYLRSKGFDVVEIGNYREELEKTLVIDRTGNTQAAVQVARAIGVPLEQVMQNIDKTMYLDVSVYIGKDYPSLQPFR